MNIGYLYVALIIVGIILGLALAFFIFELIITLRKTRTKVDEIHKQLTPTINNIETITNKIQPAVDRIDPLVERVTLTVDAANLELMRADQILENVNTITEGVADATTAVGNIANAPAELLNKAANKIGGIFGGGDKQELLEAAVAKKLVNGEEPAHLNEHKKKGFFKKKKKK